MKQLILVAVLAAFSAPAMAYVGPGLGMGAIGAIFGVIAAIVLAIFGLFWYPLKRAFGKKKAATVKQQPDLTSASLVNESTTVEEGIATRPNEAAAPRVDAPAAGRSDVPANTPGGRGA